MRPTHPGATTEPPTREVHAADLQVTFNNMFVGAAVRHSSAVPLGSATPFG